MINKATYFIQHSQIRNVNSIIIDILSFNILLNENNIHKCQSNTYFIRMTKRVLFFKIYLLY